MPSKDFGVALWGDGHFGIQDDNAVIYTPAPYRLIDIVKDARLHGYKGPLLLRFPHLISSQIATLFNAFNGARKNFNYKGDFKALFPLKVNQFPHFVDALIEAGRSFDYGLEAGSKPELLIALSKAPKGATITINGFKDKEMVSLAFIGANMEHNITLIIEGLGELETIIETAKSFKKQGFKAMPNIGMRIRLHSSVEGNWAKSGGYNSKFGLTSTELLEAYEMLKCHKMLEHFTMLHFHIGSQIETIAPLKKALREAGNIYAELKKRGANALSAIDIGGGLGVEYSQHAHAQQRHYSIEEFANDVIFVMQEIAHSKQIEEPNIITESGRFIAAPHALLVAPVLELFSQDYQAKSLRLKKSNPPLIAELQDLYQNIAKENAREYLHDALDHLESLLTLFELGYIDLEDRSNAEILTHLIIKKSLQLLKSERLSELKTVQEALQERYLVNFSLFQSMPDFWGLQQGFPLMPLTHHQSKASTPATLWDITCDSDGEIAFSAQSPLYLHDIDPKLEEYFVGFFLTGAYQEILGMRHNLFAHPTDIVVTFDNNTHQLSSIIQSQTILDILDDLDYNIEHLDASLRNTISQANALSSKEKELLLNSLLSLLNENSYLKTTQQNKALS